MVNIRPKVWNSRGYRKFDANGAKEYATIANEVFAPIYPVIARKMIEYCGVTSGCCIDIGSGAGNLSLALAEVTALEIYAMDFSEEIHKMSMENIKGRGLAGRIIPVVGDVHRMPFPDEFASLVVSRGSMRFWRNKPAAFREMKRILKPGGKGFVGGGMGSGELAEAISREMIRRGADWQNKPRKSRKSDITQWKGIMGKAGFQKYEIISDDSGFWLYFEKDGEEQRNVEEI
jgi:ubiquinone/menaquinone biosynthesis C-methylase UbiE